MDLCVTKPGRPPLGEKLQAAWPRNSSKRYTINSKPSIQLQQPSREKNVFPPADPHLSNFKMHFYVVLSRIIVTELSLVAYHLASREFSETGLFDQSYKGEETRIPP